MDLEEQEGVEHAGGRCEVCGATLTDAEQAAVLESGGPALCAVHAAEEAPVADTDAAPEEPPA